MPTGLRALFVREIKRIVSRPIYFFGIVLAPLFCYLFFPTLMENGLPTGLPIAVVDLDDTPTSRTLLRNLEAFEQTEVVLKTKDFGYAREQMQEGKVYGIFYIPKGVSTDAVAGRQPRVSYYINYSLLVAGSLTFRDMKTMSVLAPGAVDRAGRRARGQSEEYIMSQLQPIVIETHPIGNPWLNYSIYLNNMLMPGALQLLILLLTVFAIGSELKDETADQWLTAAKGSIVRALIGKLLPYTLLFFIMGMLSSMLLYGYMGFPLFNGILPMAVAMLFLIVASQSLAVFLFEILPIFRLALSGASLIGVLSISITGFSFPVFAMDPLLKAAAYLFPLRHYFLIYVSQALNGAPLQYCVNHYIYLLLFLLLPLPLLGVSLKRLMKKNEYKM